MKRPAIFFDRDNTLIVSDGYMGDPARVALISGAAEAIARARRLGYAVVVFSNQSGVARGMFSEEDVEAVNHRLDELLKAEDAGAIIDRHEFCPFHPDGTIDVYAKESDRRKPKPGMIHSAAKALALDLARSWVIGDAARDIEAGNSAGCRTVLFQDPSLKKSPAAEQASAIEPDFTVSTLSETIDYIEQHAEPSGPANAMTTTSGATENQSSSAEQTPLLSEDKPADAIPEVPGKAATVKGASPQNALTATKPEADQGKRIPKVVIGSKYVAPGAAPARTAATTATPTATAVPAEATAAKAATATRKSAQRVEEIRPAEPPATGNERMENLMEQIFLELRRDHDQHDGDFSVSKLLAGIVQVIVLAVLFLAYLNRDKHDLLQTQLMLAITLQTMTVSLLIMSRQK